MASPNMPTSGTFSNSVVRDNGLGINGTSIQTGDIYPHKQENRNQFFNSVINIFQSAPSQISLTRPNDEQQPSRQLQVQEQAQAQPLAVDAEHRREEQAQAGKHEAENHRLLKGTTGGSRPYTRKCALIALVVVGIVVVLAISLGVGLGVGLSRRDRDQDQDGKSSRYIVPHINFFQLLAP
jgi:hypothetical protein